MKKVFKVILIIIPLFFLSNCGFKVVKYESDKNFNIVNFTESGDDEVNFIITDFKNEISVSYSGIVPNLFTEGKGVVAEGYLKDRSYFEASKILAKHDENYMPPEVKAALEEN